MAAPSFRPSDADALCSTMRTIRERAEVPVLFGGMGDGQAARLSSFMGMRTRAMRDLEVRPGLGLGGRVMRSRRAAVVEDYQKCTAITGDYREAVAQERLRTIIAVPVIVGGVSRAVLYGALRDVSDLGDGVNRVFHSAAAELATELRIRDDVDRRVAMAEVARSEAAYGFEASDRERIRTLHGELRAIAALVDDLALRDRLLRAGSALVDVGRPEADPADPAAAVVALSPRELDVLAQVALGCTNVEVAARLSLSPETIKAYLKTIGSKLDTRTRMESVARARLLGLLP